MTIFPAMDESALHSHVMAANGNFNDALKRAMAPLSEPVPTSQSIFAFLPKEGDSTFLPASGIRDSAALLEELQAKYGVKLENAKSALGDGYDDLQILLCFDKYHGDVKRAISDLLGQSSRSIERSQLSISRDALRQSASLLRSGKSSLLASSGIEELPVNLNLSLFGADDLTEEDLSKPMAPLPPMLRPEDLIAQATSNDTLSPSSTSSSSDSGNQASSSEATSPPPVVVEDSRMSVWEKILKSAYEDIRIQRQEELQLQPWPTMPAGISVATASDMPSRPPVTRIVDKHELSKGDKHDSEALAEFLSGRRGDSVSQQRQAASEVAKKISTDDFVVIAHVLRSLRQFQSARKDAIAKYGNSPAPAAKKTSSAARSSSSSDPSSVKKSNGSLGGSSGEGKREEKAHDPSHPEEDCRPAPVSLLDLTEHIASQLAVGADLPSSVEMCAEMQENELVELEAILTADRIQISDSYPKIVSISLSEPSYRFFKTISEEKLVSGEESSAEFSASISFKNPLLLQLIAILPPLYPECPPIISVRTNSRSCPLTPSDFRRLEALLTTEALANSPMPCLFALEQAAETFLMEDASIKAAALRQHALGSSASGSVAAANVIDPHIFDSLKLIFSFENEHKFHRFEDILNQRNKSVKRAIALLLNGPKASGLEPALVVPGIGSNAQFPVLNLAGDIDITASLRMIGLSYAAVRVLLQAHDWRLRELSTAYLSSLSKDGGAYEAFLKRNGVALSTSSSSSSSSSTSSGNAQTDFSKFSLDEEVECPTCIVDYPRHQTFSLTCGHFLCNSCYCDYVDVNIASGGAQAITCPAPGCKFILDPVSLMALLSAKRWTTYSNMVVSHFVTTNKALAWCPSDAGCDYVIQMEEFEDGYMSLPSSRGGSSHSTSSSSLNNQHSNANHSRTTPPNASTSATLVQCKCSYAYCSRCKRPGGHFPATCSEIDQWEHEHLDKMADSSAADEEATKRMLKSITRSCPRCGLSISKSGGCPHMSCAMCGHQFCWVCFKDWESSHYACDQSEIAVMEEAKVANIRLHTVDSLLVKHKNASYDVVVTMMKDKLIPAMYRPDVSPTETAKISQRHVKSAVKQAALGALITFSDVESFLKAFEVFHLAHYLVTNSCKAAAVFHNNGLKTLFKNTKLFSSINRVIQDMIFLADVVKATEYRKEIVFHLNAAVVQLKVSMKYLLEHFNAIRMDNLIEILRS